MKGRVSRLNPLRSEGHQWSSRRGEEVLEELSERLGVEFSFKTGRILGSMCTQPHPFAAKVFRRYMEKNLADQGLFPEVNKLETEVVGIIGGFLSNPNPKGHIVSGGSEANITALWMAREKMKKPHPEVIAPITAHFSLEKAAHLLGVKLVKVGVDESFRVKVEEMERAITPHTIALVGVAGSTGLGTVDPIPHLSELALEKGLPLHIDGAFGGFVIPFLRRGEIPEFDFKLPGVSSIAIDPHKMGMAPIPAGCLVVRDGGLFESVRVRIPYMSDVEAYDEGLLGTRPGASVCAVWALLKYLGPEGYRRIVRRCMNLTRFLAEGIKGIEGLSLPIEPVLNIVGVKSERFDIRLIAQELKKRGWSATVFPSHIRIVVMPHLRRENMEQFLADLRDLVSSLERRKPQHASPQVASSP